VQVAFASLAVVGKVTVGAVPWQSLVLLRTMGASVVFVIIGLVRRERLFPPPGLRWVSLRLGFLGVFANQGLFLAGLRRTSAINATVLVATIPVFTALFALATGRETFRPRLALGMLIALIGMALVIRPERLSLDPDGLLGDVMIVINCLAYSIYLATARDVIVKHGGSSVVRWAFLVGLLFAIPLGIQPTLVHASSWSPPVLAALAYILVVPTAFTYGANALALGHVPASVVGLFVYVQPVLATLMAVTITPALSHWLGVVSHTETLTWHSLLGGITVLLGVAVATLKPTSSIPEISPNSPKYLVCIQTKYLSLNKLKS
jgi:drug/metabolite transporter (DMT)-like permease